MSGGHKDENDSVTGPGHAGNGPEWWYRTPGNDLYGPYTADELRRYVAEGRIEPAGALRRGEEGDWLPPASVFLDDGTGVVGTPPTRRVPPPTQADGGRSPTARVTYVLLGLLPFLLVALAGIHNLVAGRIASGVTQLLMSVFGVWGLSCIGAGTNGVTWCVSIPIWFVLLVWTLVEVCTVTTDGAGRTFAT